MNLMNSFYWFLLVLIVNCQFKVIVAVKSNQPNIIVVLTDDQDVVLNGMVSDLSESF